jgi:hypothetical protein
MTTIQTKVITAQILSIKELKRKNDERPYLQLHLKDRCVKVLNIFENNLKKDE